MIVINENEDIVDGLSDNPVIFFKKRKDSFKYDEFE
jgi:hypothetical protein